MTLILCCFCFFVFCGNFFNVMAPFRFSFCCHFTFRGRGSEWITAYSAILNESSKHFHVIFHLEASNLIYPNHNIFPPTLSSCFLILLCPQSPLMVACTIHQPCHYTCFLSWHILSTSNPVYVQPSHFISSYSFLCQSFLSWCILLLVVSLLWFITPPSQSITAGYPFSFACREVQMLRCTILICPKWSWIHFVISSLNIFSLHPDFCLQLVTQHVPSVLCTFTLLYSICSPKLRCPSFHIYFSNLPTEVNAQIKCSLLWEAFEDFLVKTKPSLIILYFTSSWAFIYLIFTFWLFTSNPVKSK